MNGDRLASFLELILWLTPLGLMALAWIRRLTSKPHLPEVRSIRRAVLTAGFICGTLLNLAFYAWTASVSNLIPRRSFPYWAGDVLLYTGIILSPVTAIVAVAGKGRGRGLLAINSLGLSALYAYYWVYLKDFRYP